MEMKEGKKKLYFLTPYTGSQGIKRNADNRLALSFGSPMVDHQTHSDEKDGCNLPEVLKLRGDGTGLVANTSDKCRRCQRCTLICSMGNGAKLTVQGE